MQSSGQTAHSTIVAHPSWYGHRGPGLYHDFADTATAIAGLDLVITMGAPVWVAVPFVPDWRWTREGHRTPW
jgi:hypothetical protein